MVEEECCGEFREEVRKALGGRKHLPVGWAATAEVVRETARKVLGMSSGKRKQEKETWWWNEEVQESIQRKKLAKKKWDKMGDEESKQAYKVTRQEA